jgi:vancomycin permeability regulator SanA
MRFKIIVKYCFLIFCLWFLFHIVYISIDGIKNNYQVADVAVILGNKVNRDGTISNRLKSRLDCGLQLYKNKFISKIIVSGGYGKEGYFEGDKMREYLVNTGVPDSNIIIDNKGNNTIQSVRNTKQLQQKYGFKSIIIVSQFYHISRTKMLFKKLGFNRIFSASPAYYEWRDIYSLFREYFAFYEVYFFGIK